MNRRSEGSEDESVRRDMEEVLREFGTPIMPVDLPEVAVARRNRTVSHLRALQARAVVRGQDARLWRRRLLVAALVLFPTGALAATWAVFQGPSGKGSSAAVSGNEAVPGVALGGRAPSRPGAANAQAPGPSPQCSGAVTEPSAPPNPATAERESVSEASPARVREASPSPVLAAAGRRAADSSPLGPSASAAAFKSFPDGAGQATEASTLAAENALMQAAMSAARAGDDSRAILRFSDFLARYPRSPLAENASVERSRAVARLRTERSPSEGALAPRAGAASGDVPLR